MRKESWILYVIAIGVLGVAAFDDTVTAAVEPGRFYGFLVMTGIVFVAWGALKESERKFLTEDAKVDRNLRFVLDFGIHAALYIFLFTAIHFMVLGPMIHLMK